MINWANVEFKGEKRFLSNMFRTSVLFDKDSYIATLFKHVEFDGEEYGSSEHLYQALKSNDTRWHKLIREQEDPHKTKTLYRKCLTKTPDLFGEKFGFRKDWDDVRKELMFIIVYLKFTQNKELRDKLLNTKDEILVERNDWGDTYWGECKGGGKNNLGKILMNIRSTLKEEISLELAISRIYEN